METVGYTSIYISRVLFATLISRGMNMNISAFPPNERGVWKECILIRVVQVYFSRPAPHSLELIAGVYY